MTAPAEGGRFAEPYPDDLDWSAPKARAVPESRSLRGERMYVTPS